MSTAKAFSNSSEKQGKVIIEFLEAGLAQNYH